MGKIISNGVQYSGLMNVEGAFIDTDNVIQVLTQYTPSNSWSYTATQDCVVYIELFNNEGYTITLKLNGKEVASHYDDTEKIRIAHTIFVKKGQVLTTESSSYPSGVNTRFAVYGIQSGSNVIGEIKKLNDFITLSSGYTLNANSLILKQGNFVFADIIIQKDSNFSTSQNVVGSVPSKYALVKNVQTYGVLSAQPYNKSNYNAYFLIDRNNNGQVEVWANDDGYPVVEVKFIAELS